MIQADLHVHSTYSRHPSEWFLRKIGAHESYTDVDTLYRLAKQRGMTYVTVTDHNTIEGARELLARHPDDCFISTEITSYFPDSGCKVHVLAYDIDEQQFAEIEKRRQDIYRLREFLRREDIACSVAHATYSVNNKLNVDHLEKLILLFDVFEGINGTRPAVFNQTWVRVLQHLTPADMERLYTRHHIEPWRHDSWIKGFTGGSDDHAGLLLAETYTMTEDGGIDAFIGRIRDRETFAGGRHGDHKALAFAIYKIAHEFSRHRHGTARGEALSFLNSMLFSEGPMGLREWLALRKIRSSRGPSGQAISRFFDELANHRADDTLSVEDRIKRVYDAIADLSDQYAAAIAGSVESAFRNGDAMRLFQNLSAALPAAFMAAPFFTTLRHMHQDNAMLRELVRRFPGCEQVRDRRVLWFSDTVTDLNGVAVTMRALARRAHESGRQMHLVTSMPAEKMPPDLPPNVINLPCIYHCTPEFYNAFSVHLPSPLHAIDRLAAMQPDEIVISTPGPVGALGLALARILSIKCTGVYHTDFKKQVDQFIGDEWVSSLVEGYTRSFYNQMDEVRVPTQQYIRLLEERGMDPTRMKLFRRGIEATFARSDPEAQERLRQAYRLPDGPVLLWAGRLGREKNLDFLLDTYHGVAAHLPDTVLLVAGDGPELERLRREQAGNPRVVFAGRVDRDQLPDVYSLADLFVFPSTTDTFGMVVLEAQACGLPALVTNVGGPQEIVSDGQTGYVLPADDTGPWVERIVQLLDRTQTPPAAFERLRETCRTRFRTNFTWDRVLEDIMGPAPGTLHRRTPGAPAAPRRLAAQPA